MRAADAFAADVYAVSNMVGGLGGLDLPALHLERTLHTRQRTAIAGGTAAVTVLGLAPAVHPYADVDRSDRRAPSGHIH